MAHARTWTIGVLIVTLAGCSSGGANKKASGAPAQPPPTAQVPLPANANTDPTAMYLHELAGSLLLYYAHRGELPASLSSIEGVGPEATDPASGKPFVYNPGGPPVKGYVGRLTVCQSATTHRGGRWALLVDSRAAGRLITYIEFVPESALREAQKPQSPASRPVRMNAREPQ